jgi:hypothetical protein
MPKIENYNCDGLCSQSYCDKKYTHFHTIQIKDMKVYLPFCEKHYEEFIEEAFELSKLKEKKE